MKQKLFRAGILFACLMFAGCSAEKPAAESRTQTQAPAVESTSETTGETAYGDVYMPGTFTWSGGSGKIDITCPQVRFEGDQAYATLIFSSSHYTYIRIGEEIYNGTSDETQTVFEIPVTMDETMTIAAETTAMSQPHEIEYEIYVSLAVNEDDVPPDGLPEEETEAQLPEDFKIPELAGLSYESSMDPSAAECFNVYRYSDGYQVIDVPLSGQYLVVPEGADVPDGLPEDMTVIRCPLKQIYVAATSSMSLFDAVGALDQVTMTGTDTQGWSIPAPREALESGSMTFAGKYSAPDYEMLIDRECDLAVESTMIWHTPEVKEMLEDLGIPVFVDRSSYEKSALARTEWVRVYGVLTGKEAEAEAFFEEQAAAAGQNYESTGLTVAWFSINQAGLVNVRAADDYIVQMIRDGGGVYAAVEEENTTGKALQAVSTETFYACAADADYLIYNATISDTLSGLDDLLGKDAVLADFKAVREGNVWQADQSLYQSTDHVGDLAGDIHLMLTGGDPAQMVFLKRLN